MGRGDAYTLGNTYLFYGCWLFLYGFTLYFDLRGYVDHSRSVDQARATQTPDFFGWSFDWGVGSDSTARKKYAIKLP